MNKEQGAAVFAAIEKHLPHIAADVRMKHATGPFGGDLFGQRAVDEMMEHFKRASKKGKK